MSVPALPYVAQLEDTVKTIYREPGQLLAAAPFLGRRATNAVLPLRPIE